MSRERRSESRYGAELEELLAQAASGDLEARQKLFDQYAPAFRWVIRRRLNERLRTAFDSEDFKIHKTGARTHEKIYRK